MWRIVPILIAGAIMLVAIRMRLLQFTGGMIS